jgi:N-dimethylarginine dimethylaminohydrolase
MLLAVDPSGFKIESSLNVFTEKTSAVDAILAAKQHAVLCRTVGARVLRAPSTLDLPDLVFLCNAGMWLPRLPEKVLLLSNMKYASRASETPWIEKQLHSVGIKTIRCPQTHPYEGQGESIWFHDGRLLVVGYGYRSTSKTIPMLQGCLNRVYSAYGVEPPYVLGIKMSTPKFYHLDIAMSSISPSSCILRSGSVSNVERLKQFIDVHLLKTTDDFVLNLVVLPDKIVTHKLKYQKDRRFIEKHAHRPVVEVDVSEFEKSGASVHCMLLRLGLEV